MTIDHKKQIKELNTYVMTKICPSEVHGVGVFALLDIEKGTKLMADMAPLLFNVPYKKFMEIRPEVRKMLLERWPQIVNGSPFIYPDTRIQAFMNHQDVANYDAVKDITLQYIPKGKEIFEDYRKIFGYEKVFTWLTK